MTDARNTSTEIDRSSPDGGCDRLGHLSKADNSPRKSPEAPFTTFIQLDGKSPVPSQFRVPGIFTITRLRSPVGLPDPITKLSPIPALLVSISLKSLPSTSYQVWAADKLIPTSTVHPFHSNVI